MQPEDLDQTLETANELKQVLDDLEERSRAFGAAITSALKGAVLEGDSLGEVLQSIATRFSSISLDVGLQPLENSLSTMFSGLTHSLGNATAFANGGVVSQPTAFPMAGGTGLMGEAGAEAIMPLRRGRTAGRCRRRRRRGSAGCLQCPGHRRRQLSPLRRPDQRDADPRRRSRPAGGVKGDSRE